MYSKLIPFYKDRCIYEESLVSSIKEAYAGTFIHALLRLPLGEKANTRPSWTRIWLSYLAPC